MPIARDYTSLPVKERPAGPHPRKSSSPSNIREDTTLTPDRSQSPEAYGPDTESNYKKGGKVKLAKGGAIKEPYIPDKDETFMEGPFKGKDIGPRSSGRSEGATRELAPDITSSKDQYVNPNNPKSEQAIKKGGPIKKYNKGGGVCSTSAEKQFKNNLVETSVNPTGKTGFAKGGSVSKPSWRRW